MAYDRNNVFARILRGEIPAHTVWEDAHTLAFMDVMPQADGHAPLLGYAMDGYGLYAMTDDEGIEPADLDECRGHSDDDRGYHYHVAGAGENLFIGCFHGEQGSLQ